MITVDVPDGLGVVAVFGNDFASVLYLGGEPVRMHAADCLGSVGCLAARVEPAAARPTELGVLRPTEASTARPTQAGAARTTQASTAHTTETGTARTTEASTAPTAEPGTARPAELDAVRDWLAAPGLDVREPPPVEPLRPLLRLFAGGRYAIALSTPGWRELPVLDPAPGTTRGWYRPLHGDALVVTDQWPPRSRATVDSYLARIAGGARPAAVTVRSPGGGPRYLLDGHHKLSAYKRADVRPLLIEITPERPMPLRREEFAALVPHAVHDAFARPLDDWPHFGPPPDGEG